MGKFFKSKGAICNVPIESADICDVPSSQILADLLW